MEIKYLNGKWKVQYYICSAVFVVFTVVGGLTRTILPPVIGAAVLIVSILAARSALLCPSCGCSVLQTAMRWGLDGGFFCPRCGQRIVLE